MKRALQILLQKSLGLYNFIKTIALLRAYALFCTA